MKQRLDSHPVLITPDYNETLILAIELSNSKWVLAAQVPGLANVKNKRTIEPTVEALMAAIDGYRAHGHAVQQRRRGTRTGYRQGWQCPPANHDGRVGLDLAAIPAGFCPGQMVS